MIWKAQRIEVLALDWRNQFHTCENKSEWTQILHERAGELGSQWQFEWLYQKKAKGKGKGKGKGGAKGSEGHELRRNVVGTACLGTNFGTE